ncbi:cadherin-23 [Phlebotomus argentipes]|uniref:cadherin-23 n=1 Tax=Phlebotomus argentipes TaxID=94469 RepID=UPI002892CF86|nr:cadherin-23 [Phlebotomus argentipes]
MEWSRVGLLAIILGLRSFLAAGQLINRIPHFIPGSGDMSRFSLSENTPVGSPVYQLRGVDPEGSDLRYSISGPVFTVDRDTGVVRLRQELDREAQDSVEVIISITDEGVLGTEPNTVSLRREIPIRDYNDNPPIFTGRPYSASLSESTPVGSIVIITPAITVTDRDEGMNADVTISCFSEASMDTYSVCDVFSVTTERNAEGNFSATIRLIKPLDFETRPSYLLTLKAKDGAFSNPLTALASVAINVIDVQDQPPVFVNAPYSATIEENTPADTSVMTIKAMDGDTGNPREILLSLDQEKNHHFRLKSTGDGEAVLMTTEVPLDREDPDVLQNGGIYTFNIKATELINGQVPADEALTQVTIVLTDVDDHRPKFNAPEFDIEIPENLDFDTPLPGLSVYVIDPDLGPNSRYNLSLENIKNADGVFTVSPTYGEGRTPLVVKVVNPNRLDYDVANKDLRTLEFDLVASVNGEKQASSRVTIHLQDANDNAPIFTDNSYQLKVEENAKVGFQVAQIQATDKDSGVNKKLKYILKGFGSDNFYTDSETGGLYVKKNLDYEEQKSYSMALAAVDGGGLETNANLFIDVIDLNDNYPEFESLEYTRTIREGATEFEPQFFVRATDVDGPTQGGGRIAYSIEAENSISGRVFSIDRDSGEIGILTHVSSMDTERGQYELVVAATDYGKPPLKNTTRVLIRVGISGNQRPIFKGHFSSLHTAIPGPPSYRVSIPENAEAGFNVTTVSASDPDGIDALLQYKIVGASDNFEIDEDTGLLTVSTQARLDRDSNADSYTIVVNAIDAGFPIPETATATVYVKIQDVNDKPPKFKQPSYSAYVSERAEIGSKVLDITATDTDLNADLEYSIVEPIRATSKTGLQLTSTHAFDFKHAFRVEAENGSLFVNSSLDYNLASVIILTIEARDKNAEYNVEQQVTTTEVTLYIQSFKDTNPVFKNKGWTSTRPVIYKDVKEEMPIGSILFTLAADDPITEEPIKEFDIVSPDLGGYVGINGQSGEILLKKRLDYENLTTPYVLFSVSATSRDGQRSTVTNVNITVLNVNDNVPIFSSKIYKATIMESVKFPEKIATVLARDNDAVLTERDEVNGFNKISYSISGQHSQYFTINYTTGEIVVAANHTIDREKQSVLKFTVQAEDALGKPSEARKSTSDVVIDVLDVNDNPPAFAMKTYSAVIPENVPIGSQVINISATDPDEGPGGEIRYDLLNEGEANGLLRINPITGLVETKIPLTGKGRAEPYQLVIRAQDNGGQVPKQESLYSDAFFTLYIGDVSANDGIPFFIAPHVGQIANVTENATIGSPVFQVIASDPDSPASPSGMLRFNIQNDTDDAKSFRINSKTGLISTTQPLDREAQASYSVIIVVADKGDPPQASTRVLRINVLDIDDHKPRFVREIHASPFEIETPEEQSLGSIVGNISAVDEDIDENGAIDYDIIDGNQENLFKISRTKNNSAMILVNGRLDRESVESHLLTIKCFKFTSNPRISRKPYNPHDMSEIQVLIKVRDVDDHLPEFHPANQTLGVRHNVPIDMSLLTVEVSDRDPDALPVSLELVNVTYTPQFYKRSNKSHNLRSLFSLDNQTAEVRTLNSLSDYVDGFFEITIRANNSHNASRFTDNVIKLFIIRDKSLLRFVFGRPAAEVRSMIGEFSRIVQEKLHSSALELHIFDTHVLSKADHSLDFSSTSSCFQLTRHGSALPPHEMQKVMDSDEIRELLTPTYVEYSVSAVDSCAVKRNLATGSFMSSSGTWLVILAALIGVAALIATCTSFCLFRRFKVQTKRFLTPRVPPEPYGAGAPVLYGPF